jgi:hypothetical protein
MQSENSSINYQLDFIFGIKNGKCNKNIINQDLSIKSNQINIKVSILEIIKLFNLLF